MLNWLTRPRGTKGKLLRQRAREVEDQEDEHLYSHGRGWCRELWIASLGMPAVLPPPEEEEEVKTAIGRRTARREIVLRRC